MSINESKINALHDLLLKVAEQCINAIDDLKATGPDPVIAQPRRRGRPRKIRN